MTEPEIVSEVREVVNEETDYNELTLPSDYVEQADIEYVRGKLQLHVYIPKNQIDLDPARFKDDEFDSPTTLPEAVDDTELINAIENALVEVLDLSTERVNDYMNSDMECTTSMGDLYGFTLFFNQPTN